MGPACSVCQGCFYFAQSQLKDNYGNQAACGLELQEVAQIAPGLAGVITDQMRELGPYNLSQQPSENLARSGSKTPSWQSSGSGTPLRLPRK